MKKKSKKKQKTKKTGGDKSLNTAEKNDPSLELAQWIAQILDRKGGQNISVLETKPGTYIADYLVIATGTSSRHMQTLLDAPCEELKKLGFPPQNVEGEATSWLLADLGDVVIHIFNEESRQHFDLEGLWANSPKIDWETKVSLGLQVQK